MRAWYIDRMGATDTLDVRTTTRVETIDITSLVRSAIKKSGIDTGIACVFAPHTTAGLTIQENSDPQVRGELMDHLARLAPRSDGSGNNDAHVKSSLVGASLTLIVESGKPVLGPWQAVYFCEFDGPRSRRILIRVVGG
jgi:secondary thiamine-phosphate synthase enzyme